MHLLPSSFPLYSSGRYLLTKVPSILKAVCVRVLSSLTQA